MGSAALPAGLLAGGDHHAGDRRLPELRLLPRAVGAGGVFQPVRRPAGDRQQRLPVGTDRRDELRRPGGLAEFRRPARFRSRFRRVPGGAVSAGGGSQHRAGQGDPDQDAGRDGLQPHHGGRRESGADRICRAGPGGRVLHVTDRHQPSRGGPGQHRACPAVRQCRAAELPGRTACRAARPPRNWSTAFLRPPLYSTQYWRAFGTVYTALYRPAARSVELCWPDRRWVRHFDDQDASFDVVLQPS